MTRLIRWWMSKPCSFKVALAGILTGIATPYILFLILFWIVKH